ncbi:MAG: PQQ-binding-like beta-propeller repeat protein [Paracoccaceae bacterium]
MQADRQRQAGGKIVKPIQSALIAICLVVAGCAEREVLLPGERTDLRAAVGLAEAGEVQNQARPIGLAPQTNHSEWTHRAGSASHTIQHPSLSAAPAPFWQASIGSGNDRKHRITADPVSAGGLIFTLDSRATVTATSAGGGTVWSRDLTPLTDRADDASGGGLAVVAGQLFVTTGFGGLFSLNAVDGSEQWRQRLEAPATGAPTVASGTVYVVTRDSRGWAIDASNGRVRWQVQGTPSVTGVVGGASPAVGGRVVVFPLASAEVLAALPKGGLQVWNSVVAGSRLGRAYANVNDITGDPVIIGNTIYTGTPSGRTAALDAADGTAIWTVGEGAVSPMLVDGGSVFLVTDKSRLLRLDAATGETIWSVGLPYFVPARNERRIRDVFAHYGPVLAGGRLWVASGDGQLRGFDPVSGGLVATVAMGAPAATRPIVVNGTLYLVGQNGQLLAFR